MSTASVGAWDRADLICRIRVTIELAAGLLESLRADDETSAFSTLASATARQAMRRKIVSETAFLLHCVYPARHLDKTLEQQCDHLVQLILPLARSHELLVHLCLDPSNAYLYAGAHCILSSLGYTNREFDDLLVEVVTLGRGRGYERLPSEVLEEYWLARVWPLGACWHLPHPSALSLRLDVLAGSRNGLYAFTHAVMFATGFGLWRLPGKIRRTDLILDAESALAFTLEHDDYDLMTELLMTWPHLRMKWRAGASFCFHLLAKVHNEYGFLPSQLFKKDEYHKYSGQFAQRYIYETSYHTSYVMSMLCASCLNTGFLPTLKMRKEQKHSGQGQAVLTLFNECGFRPLWLPSTNEYSPAQIDSLTPLLLTSLARHAKFTLDVSLMRTLLKIADRYQYFSIPAVDQTISLLKQLRKLTSII